LSFISKNTI